MLCSSKIANTVSLGLNESMPVRISEFHYDNTGTDAGEAVEISGPAGTSLTGYSIVLYNGSGGAVYDTDNLTGTIPNLCNGRGVVVLTIRQMESRTARRTVSHSSGRGYRGQLSSSSFF